jgi:hypothetical protein
VNTAVAGAFPVRSEGRYFYLWMAGICVFVAFGGFIPTFWAKVATGTFHAPPMIYVHGTLLFTWTLFYFMQTALVAYGRTMDHRAWGLAGIALFSVMMCMILVAQMAVLKRADALGVGDAARRFAAVSLCAWPLMAGVFTLAIVNVKRPQVHKRLMLLLMIAMLTPAIARVFLTLFAPPGAATAGPPPAFVSLPPALTADLLILVAMFHDWRTRGRPHPVYVFGGMALLAQQVLTVPIAATATWMSIATAFESLAG